MKVFPKFAQSFSATTENRWAVVLAGGDGTRLKSFTRTITGDERPKQFVPVIGGRTLLDQTLQRSRLSIPGDQTVIVVTKSHEPYYQKLTNELVVQPENRGTAPAILFPLLRIARIDPDAVVAIFPSDHYFSDDQKFMSYVDAGFESAKKSPNTVTLLGITPDSPEIEFGWIEPYSLPGNLPRGVFQVRRFWEKPTAGVARKLLNRGCLWNSFVMIGRVTAFLDMTRRALPELFSLFNAVTPVLGTAAEFANLKTLYSWLRDINFSHEVLAQRPDDLGVIKVDDVGWSDLGEPSRVLATLSRMGHETHIARSAS